MTNAGQEYKFATEAAFLAWLEEKSSLPCGKKITRMARQRSRERAEGVPKHAGTTVRMEDGRIVEIRASCTTGRSAARNPVTMICEVALMTDDPPNKLIWPTEDEMCAQAAKELSAEQLEKMKQTYREIREQYEKSLDKQKFTITTDADGKVIAATMLTREIRRTATITVRLSRKPK